MTGKAGEREGGWYALYQMSYRWPCNVKRNVKSHFGARAETLTEAGGLGRVPLAQLGAVTDVSALQDEAVVAAVMEHRALHRLPRRLHRHPAILQGRPHPRAQQHWERGQGGERDTQLERGNHTATETGVIHYLYTC